jgi:ABC-type phosphate transport system auxiliary subunit
MREQKRREQLEQEDAENKRRIAKEREEQERRERAIETPKDALHRLYKPIFDSLWDMVSKMWIVLVIVHLANSFYVSGI